MQMKYILYYYYMEVCGTRIEQSNVISELSSPLIVFLFSTNLRP